MRYIRTLLLLLGVMQIQAFTASAQSAHNDSIVYNENRPLVYEDAWDLWPYVFLNENGEPDGYNIDLLKMIFKELNIPYIIKLKPTLEAQADLKNHKSDLMLRMDANFTRDNSNFGKSIVQLFTHSIVTPKSQPVTIHKGQDLIYHPIIVHEGSFSHHYLEDHKWAKEIIPYDDMKEAILKVSIENEGVILWNTMSLKWLMQKYQTENLQLNPIEFPYGEYKFFANNTHLLAKMDSVYASLRANDRLTQIQNKWFYPERIESGIPSWIWNLIYALSALALAILAYYIIYKVREQKMTKEIRKNNDRLSLIISTCDVTLWTLDVEKQVFTIMDQHGMPKNTYSSLAFSRFYMPDDFKKLTEAIRQIVYGEMNTVTMVMKSKLTEDATEYRDLASTLSVLRRNIHNKPSVIICSETDVTENRIRQSRITDNMMRYQAIFSSSMVDMVYYDKDGYIIDMNAKALSATHLTTEQIRAMKIHVRDVLGVDEVSFKDTDKIYVTQIFDKDDPRPLNKLLKRDKLYYELQLMPIYDEKGLLIGIYGNGRDVTEIARSYQQIQRNVHELEMINSEVTQYVNNIDYVLSVGGISMVRYNLENHIITVYSEIGHQKYVLTQTRAMMLVADESKKLAQRILNKMDSRQAGSTQAEIKTIIHQRGKEGEPLYLQFNFLPITEDGKIKEYFGMCRDVSDLKAVEQKLAEETLRAQEVETIKNAFLHNMSHEIRTPLSSVVGFAELFQNEHSDADEKVFIEEIKSSSESLLKLINDILFLSRLDAEMITLNPKPVDLAGISASRCERVWGNIKKPGVEYIVRSAYKKLVIEIDENNFSIVMDKIITNAVQHTTSGSVQVVFDYIGDQLFASVEDTGSGISEDVIIHIFDRFVTDNSSGAGLGLSICHDLMEYMGGSIKLKSTVGKGTTVWVNLPCKLIEMERK
jgi:signal transduction histidine kinase/ABC-type amino acid transport substrate-binding protein